MQISKFENNPLEMLRLEMMQVWWDNPFDWYTSCAVSIDKTPRRSDINAKRLQRKA